MNYTLTRREALAAAALSTAAAQTGLKIDPAVIAQHDKAVERYLRDQVTDFASRWRGMLLDAFGIHQPHSAAGSLDVYCSAFYQPASAHHRAPALRRRIVFTAESLARLQNAEGNFDLLITNFNSPPDTAFVMRSAASAARHAWRARDREIVGLLEPTLRKAGTALAQGGVHTPNHRWVVCAALAQIHEIFPDPSYLRRIDQWLAEGIDIDADGQYSERSTIVYNPIVDSALIAVAHKLNRPALLDPVRRNLEALLYLLHPGNEVVTDISTRQDQNQRGKPQSSWFALRYMAVRDGNGQFAKLASELSPSLSPLMEYPELNQPGPAPSPLPDNYEKIFPTGHYAHIRRGATSATLMLGGYSRFFGLRRGEAVINAVRFASAFFGKAQFVPERAAKRGAGYVFEQSLDAGYYQPLDPPRPVPAGEREWYAVRDQRNRTEICRMNYTATVTETKSGFRLRIEAKGTDNVPIAVEIGVREGTAIEGCIPAPQIKDAWLLRDGRATLRMGHDTIRIGPGIAQHGYTQIRGAQPKLEGPSIYLCGYTPFDHTLDFDCG